MIRKVGIVTLGVWYQGKCSDIYLADLLAVCYLACFLVGVLPRCFFGGFSYSDWCFYTLQVIL